MGNFGLILRMGSFSIRFLNGSKKALADVVCEVAIETRIDITISLYMNCSFRLKRQSMLGLGSHRLVVFTGLHSSR